jgi:hypothetical protein
MPATFARISALEERAGLGSTRSARIPNNETFVERGVTRWEIAHEDLAEER